MISVAALWLFQQCYFLLTPLADDSKTANRTDLNAIMGAAQAVVVGKAGRLVSWEPIVGTSDDKPHQGVISLTEVLTREVWTGKMDDEHFLLVDAPRSSLDLPVTFPENLAVLCVQKIDIGKELNIRIDRKEKEETRGLTTYQVVAGGRGCFPVFKERGGEQIAELYSRIDVATPSLAILAHLSYYQPHSLRALAEIAHSATNVASGIDLFSNLEPRLDRGVMMPVNAALRPAAIAVYYYSVSGNGASGPVTPVKPQERIVNAVWRDGVSVWEETKGSRRYLGGSNVKPSQVEAVARKMAEIQDTLLGGMESVWTTIGPHTSYYAISVACCGTRAWVAISEDAWARISNVSLEGLQGDPEFQNSDNGLKAFVQMRDLMNSLRPTKCAGTFLSDPKFILVP